ncbi:MAG TPA: hypothetical protein VLR72_05250 [Clostridiaceae bacterium]|nr:hypothetical protein [Clostridiaceae bacterium]
MFKKVFYWISSVLQVLLLIAAFGIQYFSTNKMGMMRYVVFTNHKWEGQYPISLLQYTTIAILVALAAITCVKYAKSKTGLPMIAVQAVITLVFVVFTLAFSTESFRSYYFMSLMLAFIALIQGIKVLVYLKR